MIDFPSSPTIGQTRPSPPVTGVPVYTWDGEKWTATSSGTLIAAIIGSIELLSFNTVPASYLKCGGASLSRTTYAALFAALIKSATVTVTIASPGVFTWTGHTLQPNDPIKLFTTVALPTGLTAGTHGLVTAGTVYYVVGASITANTFQVSTTPGGTAVNTSGSQSGTHTAVMAPWGDGDGSTTFTVPDLRGDFLRMWDDGAGRDTNRSFGGSEQLDAFQGHIHSGQFWQGNTTGYPSGSFSGPVTFTALIGDPAADSHGNGTPRTAAETRPRNFTLMAVIRYQ